MKNLLLLFLSICIFSVLSCFTFCNRLNYALAVESEEIENQLSEATKNQLELLELNEFENLYDEYSQSDKSLKDRVKDVIDGKESFSIASIVEVFLQNIKGTIKNTIHTIFLLLVLSLISGLISNFSSNSSSIKNILNVVFVCLTASVLIFSSTTALTETVATIKAIGNFTKIVFPVLIVLVSATGAKASSTMYQPLVATLATSIITVFCGIVISIVTLLLVLTILNNLVKDVKLDKLIAFLSSLTKWIIGLSFGIFFSYTSFAGIMTASKDGISIKTAKYAIKSYVPIVGGYLSDGFEIFRAGSIVLKNSVGVVGLILLVSIILMPAIKLLVTNLLLKFTSGLVELSGEKTISNLLVDISKVFNFLLATILTVFMMCFIIILLIVMTANLV